MTTPLIPEHRVDKNGRLVLRHVKGVGADVKKQGATPIPTIAQAPLSSGERDFSLRKSKLLERQWKTEAWFFEKDEFSPSEELVSTFPKKNGDWLVSTSDVNGYDVLSVVSVDNAAFLLTNGVDTRELALAHLHKHGLEHLIEDNNERMEYALRQRARLQDFFDISTVKDTSGLSDDVVVGAAHVKRSGMLTKLAGGHTFWEAILNEEIGYRDLEEFKYSMVASKKEMGQEIYEGLRDIHQGESNLSVSRLRRVAQHSQNPEQFTLLRELVENSSDEYMNSIQLWSDAALLLEEFKDKPMEYRRDIIYCNDVMKRDLSYSRNPHPSNELAKIVDGGFDVHEIKAMLDAGVTLGTAIESKKAGVSSSLSSGWI